MFPDLVFLNIRYTYLSRVFVRLLILSCLLITPVKADQTNTFGRTHTSLGNATLTDQVECLVVGNIGDLFNGSPFDGVTIEVKNEDTSEGFTTVFEDICLDKLEPNQAFFAGVGGEYNPSAQDFFSGLLFQNFSGGNSFALFPFFNILPIGEAYPTQMGGASDSSSVLA